MERRPPQAPRRPSIRGRPQYPWVIGQTGKRRPQTKIGRHSLEKLGGGRNTGQAGQNSALASPFRLPPRTGPLPATGIEPIAPAARPRGRPAHPPPRLPRKAPPESTYPEPPRPCSPTGSPRLTVTTILLKRKTETPPIVCGRAPSHPSPTPRV